MGSDVEIEQLNYFLWKNAGERSGRAEGDWFVRDSPPRWSRARDGKRVATASNVPPTSSESS
jgi:hypothetical protein